MSTLNDRCFHSLQQFLEFEPRLRIERNGRDVQIFFATYGRTAYGWGLADAITDGQNVVADLVARKLTKGHGS